MILKFSGKCNDLCNFVVLSRDGDELKKKEGDIPSMLGDSDYVNVEIDLSTGKLLNFTPMTDEEVREEFNIEE